MVDRRDHWKREGRGRGRDHYITHHVKALVNKTRRLRSSNEILGPNGE